MWPWAMFAERSHNEKVKCGGHQHRQSQRATRQNAKQEQRVDGCPLAHRVATRAQSRTQVLKVSRLPIPGKRIEEHDAQSLSC